MKRYLNIVVTFFSLSSMHLNWCHSEKKHEWPTERSDKFLAQVIEQQEIAADEARKRKLPRRKRKHEESAAEKDNNNNNSTPELYPIIDDNDELSTQKNSDSEEEMPDIDERAPKIIKIEKNTIDINELSTLQKRIRKFGRKKGPIVTYIHRKLNI